jgi:putative protease
LSRYYNGKEIELLAPAGTFEIFKQVVEARCDAVYLGGPVLNMRMMRKGYNLSLTELAEARNIAHGLGKKLYVTVNNLFSEEDLAEARPYLAQLNEIAPDALIVQDMAVPVLIREMGLTLPIHASVMMNTHNLEMILALQELGVSRVVTSREMDLATAKRLSLQSGMELEYFVHGDMCSVHGANCFYSSQVFGMSSNRGKCMKPCRWDYRVKKDGFVYPAEYPLAVKDMYMYEHLPELIDANITSFKIEGRMREADFMVTLVNAYGAAIDRYIDDPVGFERKADSALLYETRKRDFSTAYAFGKPGLANINRRYEGTGKFYSTGKVFSTPTEERELSEARVGQIKEQLADRAAGSAAMQPAQEHSQEGGLLSSLQSSQQALQPSPKQPLQQPAQLAVRVNNAAQALVAIKCGVEHLYLSGDVYEPDRPFTKQQIQQLGELKGNTKLYLALPRMMQELQFDQYDGLLLHGGKLPIDGLLVTNLGAIRRYRNAGYPLVGDASLNIYNHLAANWYAELGLERLTVSSEMTLEHFADLAACSQQPLEVVVHGSTLLMYLEHDLYANTIGFEPVGKEDNTYVANEILVLKTDKGENPVRRDGYGRNHLLMAKELCYLPLLGEMACLGVSVFRIEGATYTPEQLAAVIAVYQRCMFEGYAPLPVDALAPAYAGYTLGSLQFN